MTNRKQINVFVANKSKDISDLFLTLSKVVDVNLSPDRNGVCFLKVAPEDYVRATIVGSGLAERNGLQGIAWVMPCGKLETELNEVNEYSAKQLKNGKFVAFVGSNKAELESVSNYLNKCGMNSNVIANDCQNTIVVSSKDYFSAVAIGAKFVDGHNMNSVFWVTPTGRSMFNTNKVASLARHEYDDVLQA